jgi:hypothetical protein
MKIRVCDNAFPICLVSNKTSLLQDVRWGARARDVEVVNLYLTIWAKEAMGICSIARQMGNRS